MTTRLTSAARALLLLSLAVALQGCVSAPRVALAEAERADECVVLLHGLNRSWRAMRTMAAALHQAGYSTANVDYPSQAGPIETLAPLAVESGLKSCRDAGAGRIHFVTHSIGGILLRYAHDVEPIPDLGRVVMLAPPNQGSEVVDITRDWPTAALFGGEAGLQLGTGADSIPRQLGPADFELGVIAGTGTTNLLFSAMLPESDDGKVTVASTQVDGMDDFLVVRNSHFFIMTDRNVIDNTRAFLETGAFLESGIAPDTLSDEIARRRVARRAFFH